jgi:23S rRNA pseudouridine955/2504/2580 synthase
LCQGGRNTGDWSYCKNQESYDILLKKIEAREIRKYYKCLVMGRMERSKAQLKAYLWKDARKSMVYVSNQKSKGAQEIITAYKVLEYDPATDVSMLEVELITGRTIKSGPFGL